MGFFSDLLGGKKSSPSVLGVDIGSSSLKVVQLRKSQGSAVLETYGELALGPYGGLEVGQATSLPADKVAETLRDLMREANVTTNVCGVSIPFSRSLLTLIELPRRDNPTERKTMIELEARKYIPVPVSEVQLDWFVIPEPIPERDGSRAEQKGTMQVLLVAVHNDELTFLQSVVSGASLAASFYELEIFSTIRAVVDEPIKPTLVLDIGAATTKAYVVERGVVMLSHSIPHGGQEATQAIARAQGLSIPSAEKLKKESGFSEDGTSARAPLELVFSTVFSETRRMLVQYETASGKPIAAVVLSGGAGATRALKEYATSFFNMEVKTADPFLKTQAPAFMRETLQAIGPEFAVAVGLALRKLEEVN